MWAYSRRLLGYRTYIFQHRTSDPVNVVAIAARGYNDDSTISVSKLFQPATIKENDANNIGAELTGKINKSQLLSILNKFSQKKEIFNLCRDHGLDGMCFVECTEIEIL